MTDSMKFGPEWLRNMSNDMNSSTNTSSIATTSGPRYQLAEYRYGREEMLSLFDKNLKLPEILPAFKKLFVDKMQCPLALTPSTEDEVVNSARPWGLRSPVGFGAPSRGIGRGVSVDRGRGRPRGAYHTTLGYQRPTALYDEDIRSLGRGDRGWPERNGGNELGSGDWNGSPSSSPRKEYTPHGRSSNMENWRRSNRTEDDPSDGWRSGSQTNTGSTYRWSRSTSWRDEDNTSAGGGADASSISGISRSFSSSATTSNPGIERSASSSSASAYKSGSHLPSSGSDNSAKQWDQDDMLPEWAMENPIDGGGTFDATGAFHGSSEENDDEQLANLQKEQKTNKSECDDGGSGGVVLEQQRLPNEEREIGKIGSDNQSESNQPDDEVSGKSKLIDKLNDATISNVDGENIVENSVHLNQNFNVNESKPNILIKDSIKISGQPTQQQHQHHHLPPSSIEQNLLNHPSSVATTMTKQILRMTDLSDRMQEVADDMIEKLIMDDELTSSSATKPLLSKTSSSSVATVPIMKKTSVTGNSPTANSLLQQPLVNNHTLIHQPPQVSPTPLGSDLWYYRDPQGKVQGPFVAAEMVEWYRAGYFDDNLHVRRVCDSRFAALGELLKITGPNLPFLSSHMIPPMPVEMPVPQPVPHQPSQATQHPQPPNPIASANKPNVNTMLGTNDMVSSINLQLQVLQKQFFMRQHALILNKLATTEPWSVLDPEQRQQLLNQQMSQVVLPDYLMSPTALNNSMITPSAYTIQQMMTAAKNDLNPPKPLSQLHNTMNPFVGGNHPDYASPLHNLMQGNVTTQAVLGGGGGQQQALPPSHHPGNVVPPIENDPIKSLLVQLQLQKGGVMPPSISPSKPNLSNKWPTGGIVPQVQSPQVPHQHQHQPWSVVAPVAPPTDIQNNSGVQQPVTMWDFTGGITHSNSKPEMKTEQQILDEQKQRLRPVENSTIAINDVIHQQQQHEQHGVPDGHHHQVQPLQQHLHHHNQNHHHNPQQQQQHQSLQNQQPLSKREQFQQIQQQEKAKIEEKLKNHNKLDDEPKKFNNKKVDKKDANSQQKKSSEDDRKKESAEEKRKQKEEKKRQQMEDEKRRQDDEKRRLMLDEKKRQEDIDQHRRSKLMENSLPKPPKQQPSYESANIRNITPSSIAPWSNTGLAGITAPGPNFAEIQKAERERRAEEHRLALVTEHQRKTHQLELQVQKENSLKWNAQPLKSLNVKSLAEIQAEEHKKQLANEQQQQLVVSTTATEQIRRKETDGGGPSLQQSSTYGGSNSNSSNNNINNININNSGNFGSIWNTRPSQSIAWNGKAWSTTSSAGFWEEPTKIPSNQNNSAKHQLPMVNARTLSKSQTISNMQSMKNGTNNNIIGIGAASNTTNNGNSGGGLGIGSKQSAILHNSTSNNNGNNVGSKSSKLSTTIACKINPQNHKMASGGGINTSNIGGGSSGKKDEARNEFTSWCIKTLSSMNSVVDVPTFVAFLQDIESPYEVKDYIRMYLGETKDCSEFAKQFLERRSKYKNQQRAQNAHIDDMCSPAPAINPSSNDFQEVKGKGKKIKKSKMTKLDARILGFSVTAAQDRINVGDRDYGDAS